MKRLWMRIAFLKLTNLDARYDGDCGIAGEPEGLSLHALNLAASHPPYKCLGRRHTSSHSLDVNDSKKISV